MDQMTMRHRARVPAIDCKSGASGSRLDRHLAVLVGPAVPQHQVEEATSLMREITAPRRGHACASRGTHVSLFAPLRRLRRSLFGDRG